MLSTILICALEMTGCARYEFDVVQPPELARHIADKWENARWGPVDYRLRVMENHLVVEVQNVTREEIRILGDRSYVVGPNGQSHPLATRLCFAGTTSSGFDKKNSSESINR